MPDLALDDESVAVREVVLAGCRREAQQRVRADACEERRRRPSASALSSVVSAIGRHDIERARALSPPGADAEVAQVTD